MIKKLLYKMTEKVFIATVEFIVDKIPKVEPDPDCECCPGYLKEGKECCCKEPYVTEIDGKIVDEFYHRGECTNWDCSYCH